MTGRRRLGVWVVAILAFVGLGLLARLFVFDRPSTEAHDLTLQVATLDVSAGPGDAILTAQGMAPGDVATGVFTVTNSSRGPLTYTMHHGTISADRAALGAALQLTIRAVGSSCADFDGAVLYAGPLDEATFGDGPTVRDLAGATADILCFRAALPIEAGNGLQGTATAVRLSFAAYQVGGTP
jgi:hypothetical protein